MALIMNHSSWFESYLTNRSQRVKIGDQLSNGIKLKSGVPQGGVLSPIIFVVYVSDLEDWLCHSTALTYADDTTSSVTGKEITTVMSHMEFDADKLLRYMASNGMVANPKKTAMLILNLKSNSEEQIKIRIGEEEIFQVHSAKLLGMTFNDKQNWSDHVAGKGGLLKALNQRLFLIRRLKNVLNHTALLKVADSLFMSKIRYGLQLLGKVRTEEDAPKNQMLTSIQKAQNKLVRLLTNTRLAEGINTKAMLDKCGLLSVNQTHAQIKLLEIWKSLNVKDYPIQVSQPTRSLETATTRSVGSSILQEFGKTNITQKTCINDATKIWNQAPQTIKQCVSLYSARKAIKTYVKMLPI